jgi:hypothetical protein
MNTNPQRKVLLTTPRKLAGLVALAALIPAAAFAATAVTTPPGPYTACSSPKEVLTVEVKGKCPSGTVQVTINAQGVPGPTGAQGPSGPQGPPGPTGPPASASGDVVVTSTTMSGGSGGNGVPGGTYQWSIALCPSPGESYAVGGGSSLANVPTDGSAAAGFTLDESQPHNIGTFGGTDATGWYSYYQANGPNGPANWTVTTWVICSF